MYLYLGFPVLLIIAFLYYILYAQPKQKFDRYVRQFKSGGYRVYTILFNPFSITIFQIQQQEAKRYNSIMLITTSVFNKYDVVIANFFTTPWIAITSPHFLKQFVCREAEFLYEKHKPAQRILGNGLLFSNGERWVKKRKILNKVFKFDDIKNLHAIIAKKAQEGLRYIQSKQNESSKVKKVSFQDYGFYLTEKTILECFLGSEDSKKAVLDGKTVANYNVKLIDEYVQSLLTDPLSLILGEKFENLGLSLFYWTTQSRSSFFTKSPQI